MAKRHYTNYSRGSPGNDGCQWWLQPRRSQMGDLTMSYPDEPILEGSDDDFNDLSSVESEEEDEGFPDHSRVCSQTLPPTNNTTAANGHNSTIPQTIAANPSSLIVIVVVIVPLNPSHGLILCILSPSIPSLLPLVLLFQILNLHWTRSHSSPKDHKCSLLTGSRDRYRELLRYLHFADRYFGILWISRLRSARESATCDHLSKKFAELYQPHWEVGTILSQTV